MAKSNVISAIDLGEDQFIVLAAVPMKASFELAGIGMASSKGFSRGMITNINEAAEALSGAVRQAEIMAGAKLSGTAIAGVSGEHIYGEDKHAHVKIQGGAVTEADIDLALDTLEAFPVPAGLKIIHVVEQEFAIDGQRGIRHPLGMNGALLEADAHVVTASDNVMANTKSCLVKAGAAPLRLMSSALAAGTAITTADERELGVLALDWGCGTCDYAFFQHSALQKLGTLPIGCSDIDRDIARMHRISIPNSERVKREIGSAVQVNLDNDRSIVVEDAAGENSTTIEPQVLSMTIQARADEMLETLKKDLGDVLNKDRLPAGIVIAGGMSRLTGFVELCYDELGVPVRIGKASYSGANAEDVAGPEYACALGLLQLWSAQATNQEEKQHPGPLASWLQKIFGGESRQESQNHQGG